MTLPRVSRLLLIRPASLARTSTAPDLRTKQNCKQVTITHEAVLQNVALDHLAELDLMKPIRAFVAFG